MRFTIDSNILVYACQDIDVRSHISRSILDALPGLDIVFTTQALGEFLNVVRRKNRQELPIAIEAVGLWSLVYPCASTQPDDLLAAIRLAERYRLQLWDSVILTVARAADVELMLSEDMQDGALYDGIRVMDPFLPANSTAFFPPTRPRSIPCSDPRHDRRDVGGRSSGRIIRGSYEKGRPRCRERPSRSNRAWERPALFR